jgi:hypothetical protein
MPAEAGGVRGIMPAEARGIWGEMSVLRHWFVCCVPRAIELIYIIRVKHRQKICGFLRAERLVVLIGGDFFVYIVYGVFYIIKRFAPA